MHREYKGFGVDSNKTCGSCGTKIRKCDFGMASLKLCDGRSFNVMTNGYSCKCREMLEVLPVKILSEE